MEDKQFDNLKLYMQSMIAQLVKIEKDLRSENEALLCMVIEMVEMNRLTLKTLQVQFNVFMNTEPLEREIDDEIRKLKERVGRHKDSAKEISNLMSLPAPESE